MITFNLKSALQFVGLISEQRDLYDPNSPYFNSKNRRAKIWEEIAIKCNRKGLTGNTCKNLWNKLKRSYAYYKKNGGVNRTGAKADIFKRMALLEVKKQQGNEKKPQANKNQQQNKNVQQDNANQLKGKENQQQRKNNQQDIEKNVGPKNKNAVNKQQGNEIKLGSKTTDGLLEFNNQQVLQKKSPGKCAASHSGPALQNTIPPVQLNISGFEINFDSKSNEESRQQRQNEDKSMDDELYIFSTQVRTILGNLPRELQIEAQADVFGVLSKYKTLALSKSPDNNTEKLSTT